MSEDKKADKKVFNKIQSKISVSDKTLQPQLSSPLIYSKNVSTPKKSVLSKLFSWNHEKPRPNGEYVEKKFGEPYNIVAPELRMIGGLGPIKCVGKQKHQLINRPTQVQKVCHTKTKLLPNFNLTEELWPAACRKKKKLTVADIADRVKFVENLETPSLTPVLNEKTKETFNHQNPFNLDLNALSAYQKQKHNAEEMERRRNYQIIRRTMETKALKTEGMEKIKQEARNDKFKLPAFFKVLAEDENVMSENSAEVHPLKCQIVSAIDKPKNREILKRHYQHKEEKLRERLLKKAENDAKLAREMEELEKERRENFVFRLADESLPASECDANEHVAVKELPPTYEKLDNPVNKSELIELKRQLNEKSLDVIKRDKLLVPMTVNNANDDKEVGISCGQKMGNRIVLRSFHDRICSEPRGESNYYHLKGTGEYSTCLTHNQWLDSLANDAEILKEPPRAKLLSTLKVEQEPNDVKTYLFDDASKLPTKNNVTIVSPIRQHFQQFDEKMKKRMNQSNAKKAKSHMYIVSNENNNGNLNSKRYQRMKFMGIPVRQSSYSPMMKVSQANLKTIVAKISQTSMLLSHEIPLNDKSTPKRKHSRANISPRVVKLMPKLPELDCSMEEERERLNFDKFVPFSKAQPRGTNAKNLRADKSLPWIEDELNATKVKLQKDLENGKTFTNDMVQAGKAPVKLKGKIDENTSAMKKSFNRIIASKLQNCKPTDKKSNEVENDEGNDEDAENAIQIQSVESSSSLSSEGTYLTDDSGSILMLCDQKIPKREMNLEKKFQNRSLVTTEEIPPMEPNPYFIPKVEQYEMIKAMKKPKDRFHTHRTRSCANIRDRIKIESLEYDEELFGTEAFKMVSKMATDMDEYYQSEFYNERSHTTFVFKPRTEITKLRETFRKSMDIYWMKEQIIKGQIESMHHEILIETIKAQVTDYDTFLDAQKEQVYRNTNRTMQDVKKYYAATNELQKRREFLETQIEPLKMTVFYLGIDFVKCMIIQNFQYLLKPIEWRKKFDYIHRNSDGKLESYVESIANREMVNLWNRESVTVFTIKDFIENVYLKNDRRPQPIFDSGKDLLAAFRELQSKSCRSLRQFQFIAHTLADTEKEFITLEENNTVYINKLATLVNSLSRNRVFMEKRSIEIKALAQQTVEKQFKESIAADELRTTQGLIDLMFLKVLSNHNEDEASSSNLTHFEKTSALESRVFGIFDEMDKISRDILTEVEFEVRNEQKVKLRDGHKAYRIEMDLKQRTDQFERCIAKPPKKKKREGKLPMSVIPKQPLKQKIKKALLTPLEQDYARAFTEFGASGEIKFDEDAKKMIDRIKNDSIPFYVDHLLDTLRVKAPRDAPANTESILSDEEKNFKYKDVLPRVRSQVKLWEMHRKKVKQENIRKTQYLYEP